MGNVLLITATSGRHTLLERCVGMFLSQDYGGDAIQVVFNNSDIPQILDKDITTPVNKRVIIVNSCNKGYTSLGEIYNDILRYVPESEIISHLDDDDIILPNHISEGVKGYKEAEEKGYLAYKPKRSYYRSGKKASIVENTMEPSIFINSPYLKRTGYKNTTADQHMQWVLPLINGNRLYVKEDGIPTLVYEWGNEVPTWKTSGDPINPLNFSNYKRFSQDHGDGVITPWNKEKVDNLYSQINKLIPHEDI